MTTYYLVRREKDGSWSACRDNHRQGVRITKQPFSTYTEAEDFIREYHNNLKRVKYTWDRPWIDHQVRTGKWASKGHLMTLKEWKQNCNNGGFIDYDGFEEMLDGNFKTVEIGDWTHISPSHYTKSKKTIPQNVEYILWFNR